VVDLALEDLVVVLVALVVVLVGLAVAKDRRGDVEVAKRLSDLVVQSNLGR
jgi:hypothetical protein